MKARALRITTHIFVFLLCLTGCSSLAPLLASRTPEPFGSAQDKPDPSAAALTEAAPAPSDIFQHTPGPNIPQTPSPSAIDPRVLRLWLPSQFDPQAGTPSGDILKQRIADFEAGHPGLEIEVRVKSDAGETNLVNALSITSMAAPTALPDLVALSRPALESAALKGLLRPMDGLSVALDDSNWHGYARQLGHIQNTGYGLPFAGDALMLLQRVELEEMETWPKILAGEHRLAFAAGDPQASVGLSLYVSAGGKLVDTQGEPTLDREILTRLLTFVSEGVTAGVFQSSSAGMVSDQEALQEYLSQDAEMAIVWASSHRPLEGEAAMPLPPLDEMPVSFATGWLWALAGSNPENQQLAVELAEYLAADDFITSWTRETGYLPTRPSSLAPGDSSTAAILEAAQPIPSNDVLSVLSPLMQEALTRVLKGEPPDVVAGSVTAKLK